MNKYFFFHFSSQIERALRARPHISSHRLRLLNDTTFHVYTLSFPPRAFVARLFLIIFAVLVIFHQQEKKFFLRKFFNFHFSLIRLLYFFVSRKKSRKSGEAGKKSRAAREFVEFFPLVAGLIFLITFPRKRFKKCQPDRTQSNVSHIVIYMNENFIKFRINQKIIWNKLDEEICYDKSQSVELKTSPKCI